MQKSVLVKCIAPIGDNLKSISANAIIASLCVYSMWCGSLQRSHSDFLTTAQLTGTPDGRHYHHYPGMPPSLSLQSMESRHVWCEGMQTHAVTAWWGGGGMNCRWLVEDGMQFVASF